MSAGTAGARRQLPKVPRFAWQRAYTAGVLALILLIVYIIWSHSLTAIEALGITNNALPLALAAVGETFVIMTNGIDLSVGSMVTLGNVVVAVLMGKGFGPAAIVIALAAGAAAGFINGLIVSYLRIASLIATLATGSMILGAALIVLPNPGGKIDGWLSNVTSGSIGTFPVAGIWLIAMVIFGWVLLRRTRYGIELQALGGNESASRSAGINVTRVRILAYTASGLCSALAGIVLGGLTTSGDPTIGTPYLLDAVAAVIVGGTALAGGVGTLAGSVLGALVLSLVDAVLFVSGINTSYQYIVNGAIVIGALIVHSFQFKLGARAATRSRFMLETSAEESA